METEVLTIVEAIYAAGTSRARWNGLLEAIPDLAGGDAANLLVVRPQAATMTVLSPRTDPAFVAAFFTDWWREDPTYGLTLTAPVGQVVTLADTGRERFRASRFHNEFWTTSGHGADRLRANLVRTRDIQIGFGLMPSARDDVITLHMRRIYDAILPHMIRSVAIEWRIQRLEMERALALAGQGGDGTGALVVNRDGRILLADATAEAILARGAPLRAHHGVLHALEARDTDDLHRLIRSCLPRASGYSLRGGSARIRYADSAGLTLTAMPLPDDTAGFALDVDANVRPAAIVTFEDGAARRAAQAARLQSRFGLTKREAEVALACLRGGPRAQLAERLGLSDSTVRTHLGRIYDKTRTTRKAELLALLHRLGISD